MFNAVEDKLGYFPLSAFFLTPPMSRCNFQRGGGANPTDKTTFFKNPSNDI